mgnify:CR=1 FL=1
MESDRRPCGVTDSEPSAVQGLTCANTTDQFVSTAWSGLSCGDNSLTYQAFVALGGKSEV